MAEQEELALDGKNEEGEEKSPEPSQTSADLAALREELAELRGRLSVTSAPAPVAAAPAREEPRDLSASELQAMVDRGDITEDQKTERLFDQQERRLAKRLSEELDARESQNRGATMMQTEFAKYRARLPDIDDPNSENRAKVQAKYSSLLAAGWPSTDQTQLSALAMVFGPPESVPEKRRTSDTSREGGASASDDHGSEGAGEGWKRGLPASHVKHYEKMLERGQYKGVDDPTFKADVKAARGRGSAGRGEARVQ